MHSCRQAVLNAVSDLSRGKPVLVFDSIGREEEVDMIFYAGLIDVDKIFTLRRVAGGLICYATSEEVTRALGIPFGDEIYSMVSSLRPLTLKRPSYGDRPAFTIWINHVSTRTGISDHDRCITIRRLHDLAVLVTKGRITEARRIFTNEFIAPGHVPILAARIGSNRRGHTELSIMLSKLASLPPSMVLAEMLGKGDSLNYEAAERVAAENNWVLITGDEIINCYESLGEA